MKDKILENLLYNLPENIKIRLCNHGIDNTVVEQLDNHTLRLVNSITAQACYSTGQINIKDIIELPKNKLEVLLSPNANIAYHEGINSSNLIQYSAQDIDLLISYVARMAYKSGFIDIETLSTKSLNEKQELLHQYCNQEIKEKELSVDKPIDSLIYDQVTEFIKLDLPHSEKSLSLIGENDFSVVDQT